MTAQIIPFADWSLCGCGAGVASFPVGGGFVCEACAGELEAKRMSIAAAEIMLAEPDQTPLADLLAKFTEPSP